MKEFKVNLNWSNIVEAENEEEVKEEVRKVFDETLLKLDIQDLQIKERGSSSINIEMTDSKVVVRHGQDGDILYEGEVSAGYWDNLWKAIKQ